MEFTHIPVLLNESIDILDVNHGKKYIDATAGGGGYTEEILKRGGKVLAIDQDMDAVSYLRHNLKLKIENKTLTIVHGNFKDIKEIAKKNNFEKVDGIIFDLGFSSNQIEKSKRGFSFMRDEVLDMRMSTDNTFTAKDIITKYSEDELYELFIKGEEHNARIIAHAIIDARRDKNIETTKQLVDIIKSVLGSQSNLNPATKVFQALRMEVNQELINLEKGLSDAFELLENNGKIGVVSFHSLEDRIVKFKFKEWEKRGFANILTKKPITATVDELSKNRRARSAKLRAIRKLIANNQ